MRRDALLSLLLAVLLALGAGCLSDDRDDTDDGGGGTPGGAGDDDDTTPQMDRDPAPESIPEGEATGSANGG